MAPKGLTALGEQLFGGELGVELIGLSNGHLQHVRLHGRGGTRIARVTQRGLTATSSKLDEVQDAS